MSPPERWARARILIAIGFGVPILLGAGRPAGLADVADVRTWSYDDYTRVVVEFEGAFSLETPSVTRLAEDPEAGRPERLYVDVPGVWVGRRYDSGLPIGDGLLEGVRIGQNTLSVSRLVIDLARYGRHRVFTLPEPARLVLDVYGEEDRGLGRSGRLPAGLRRVHTVVVDPGHGGRDPGALGVGGLREKDVNLGIARALATELRAATPAPGAVHVITFSHFVPRRELYRWVPAAAAAGPASGGGASAGASSGPSFKSKET